MWISQARLEKIIDDRVTSAIQNHNDHTKSHPYSQVLNPFQIMVRDRFRLLEAKLGLKLIGPGRVEPHYEKVGKK